MFHIDNFELRLPRTSPLTGGGEMVKNEGTCGRKRRHGQGGNWTLPADTKGRWALRSNLLLRKFKFQEVKYVLNLNFYKIHVFNVHS